MTAPDNCPVPGAVYWVDLDPVVGSEQGGRRPVVVISPTTINSKLPVVVVATITSQSRFASEIVPTLAAGEPLPKKSYVLTFQIRTLSITRLQQYVGSLTPDQMSEVKRGLAIVFGLLHPRG